MGLRDRLQAEVRAALRQAAREGGQVNRATRVNAVIVYNVGGGSTPTTTAASAEQHAPIVQDGRRVEDDDPPEA